MFGVRAYKNAIRTGYYTGHGIKTSWLRRGVFGMMKIQKRDGSYAEYDESKVVQAVMKAGVGYAATGWRG